jgi:small conductance mechanosensitive channel
MDKGLEHVNQYWNELQPIIVEYGLKIIGAVVILIVGLWLSKKIKNGVTKAMRKNKIDETLVRFISSVTYIALVAFVVLATISQVGIETTSIVAILGAASFAVGLALQGSLSNFAAGVMLIIFHPFKVSEYIEAAGVKGTVEEIGVFVTRLLTPDNKVIYVPNSKLFGDVITNYSERDVRRVDMVFGISYTDDIDKAKKIIADVLGSHPKVLKEPEPMIVVSELADSSVNFAVRPWVNTPDYWDVYFEITEIIKKRFDEEGISIPFPQTDVHLFQENSQN